MFQGASFATTSLLDTIYRFEEHHILPLAGGWLDQPAAFVKAYEVFKSGAGYYKSKRLEIKNTLDTLMRDAKEIKNDKECQH